MPTRGSFWTSFIGAMILIGAIIAVPLVAEQVESGESAFFAAGGLSLETVAGIQTANDLLPVMKRNVNDGVDGSDVLGNVFVECEGAGGFTNRITDAEPQNLSTNLTVFDGAYASTVLVMGGSSSICNDVALPGGNDIGTPAIRHIFYMHVDKQDMLDTEVIRFVAHADENYTILAVAVNFKVQAGTGAGFPAQEGTYQIQSPVDSPTGAYGAVYEIPLTTQDRLQIDNVDAPSSAIFEEFLQVQLYVKAADSPDIGELVIYDMDLMKSREGALTSTSRLIMTNLVGGVFITLGGILALPRVDASDLLPGGE